MFNAPIMTPLFFVVIIETLEPNSYFFMLFAFADAPENEAHEDNKFYRCPLINANGSFTLNVPAKEVTLVGQKLIHV